MNKHLLPRIIIKRHRPLRIENQIVAAAKNTVASCLFQGWNLVQIVGNRHSAIHRQYSAPIAENARLGRIIETNFQQIFVCDVVNT